MDNRSQIIQSLKEVARRVIPDGGEVWLYGSQARDDAGVDSDWNILILLNKPSIAATDEDDYSYPFVDMGWNYATAVSPQLYTFNEWKKLSFTPYYQNVERDNIRLN